jgi:putative ATPase
MQMSLIENTPENSYQPLAARMRPRTINEFIGQSHLLGQGKPLRRAIENKVLHSMILWGPPGCGKTTLAKLLAASANAHVVSISAVLAGVKDIRDVVKVAKDARAVKNQPTILFVDEVL